MNEIIVPCSTPIDGRTQYGFVALNPDGSFIGGAQGSLYKMQAYYSTDATYKNEYYAEAVVGTLLTEAKWRIFRIRSLVATNKFYDKTFAGTSFDKEATDLTTVEAYDYN